jgi:hypothetical protein
MHDASGAAMSLINRNTGIHNHLSRRVGKKHDNLHTVTSPKPGDAGSTTATEKPRFYAPLQYDDKEPAPTTSNKSIFHL